MSNLDVVLVAGSQNLNDGVNTFLVSWKLGAPLRAAEQLGGPGSDIAASGPVDESAWVESVFNVAIAGSSVDDVSARIAAIAAELRDLSDWTIGLKNSAYTGLLRVKLGHCIEVPLDYPWDGRLMNAAKTQVEIVIEREPWVYGETDTLYDAFAVTVPCALDLSAMIGDARAPLTLLLDAWSANLHQVIAGVYPADAQPISTFVREAVDLTWSGGAADADANGWPDGVGNTVWKTNAAAGVYADIDVTDFIAGTYAVYANAKRDAGCDPATIETTYTAPVDIEGTDLRRHFLGLVSLPCAKVRGSATSTLRLTLKGDGTDYVCLNTVEFIPCHAGLIGWHHATAGSSADKLRWEDEVVYADDAASLGYSLADREIIAKVGTLVITGEATTEAPELDVDASASYVPRWEQLPGAPVESSPPSIEKLIFESSFEDDIDTDGLSDEWTLGGSVSMTPTMVAAIGEGTYSQRLQYSGGVGDSNENAWIITPFSHRGIVTPGDTVYVSGVMKGSILGCTMYVRISAWDSAKSELETHDRRLYPWSETMEFAHSHVMPPDTAYVTVSFIASGIDDGDVIDLTLDDVRVVVPNPADGGLAFLTSFEVDENGNGVADELAGAGPVSATYSLVAAIGEGSKAQRTQYTAPGGTMDRWFAWLSNSLCGVGMAVAGAIVRLRIKATGSNSGGSCAPMLWYYDADYVLVGQSYRTLVPTPDVAVWEMYRKLPATTMYVKAGMYFYDLDAGDTIDLTVDDMRVDVVDTTSSLAVFHGDSMTYGSGAVHGVSDYPTLTAPTGSWTKINLGTPGGTIDSFRSNAAAAVDPFYDANRPTNIVAIWAGTNDMAVGGYTPAEVLDDLTVYGQARKAVGWKVLTFTILPRSDPGISGTFEADRQTANAAIRETWSTYADALVDVAADTRIGDAGDSNDTTYYNADKVHLNAAGNAIVAEIVEAAIESLT